MARLFQDQNWLKALSLLAAFTEEMIRYPDLTDAQWELVAPLLPAAKHGGRPRSVNLREVFYATSTKSVAFVVRTRSLVLPPLFWK
jgi:hypothetical protein